MRIGLAVGVGLGVLVSCAAVPATASPNGEESGQAQQEWRMGGHDYYNTKSNPDEHTINTGNAHELAIKWTYTAHGDTSAIPTVADGAVYVPDWGGYFTKLDQETGEVIWSRQVAEWTGLEGTDTRSSPAISDGILYFGDQNGPQGGVGATLMAVSAETGDLVWKTKLDEHFAAVLTGSPVVHNGVVYQGVSSKEAAAAGGLPGYPCCTFRGSVNALDARTGEVLWKTYTVPENGGVPGGYAGGGVWGTSPVIDDVNGTIVVGTGQNVAVPASLSQCQASGGTPDECVPDDNHIDQMLALDLVTGEIRWAAGPKVFDAWTVSCEPGWLPGSCPPLPGGDFDFGEGGHLITIPGPDGKDRRVIGAGQKSGEYWLLDAATGEVVWKTQVGPGGVHGGIEWGSATDGKRFYLSNANTNHIPYTLPNGQTTTNGIFFALDAVTGEILWQVADPSNDETMGAVTVANGVMFAGSMSGHMYAFDGATGEILWDFLGEGSSNAAPAIVDGTLFWGNGYKNRFISRNPSTTFYAFSVGGR